mgnify:CR=1 FL=1
MFELTLQNLLSPMVLFFVLGLAAALARSDLSVPEAVARLLALYLLISIGFRGGVEVAHHGFTMQLTLTVLSGLLLSFSLPFLAYGYLKRATRLSTRLHSCSPACWFSMPMIVCSSRSSSGCVAAQRCRSRPEAASAIALQ